MSLIDFISEEELLKLDKYRSTYAGYPISDAIKAPIVDILRHWDNAKADLFELLDGNLILSKEFKSAKSIEQKRYSWDLNYYKDFPNSCENFLSLIKDKLYSICPSHIRNAWSTANFINPTDVELFYSYTTLRNKVAYIDNLLTNSYTQESTTVTLPVSKRKLKISHGMKITKILKKLSEEFGIEKQYEEFRLYQSQFLNDATIKGQLCLSIHPLDYWTMSDNDNNWSSCMSWREDGCYKRGTVDMMNSPVVIVAYLHNPSHPMTDDYGSWNNKKWRMLIIVNKNVCYGIRQYPYDNEDLAKKAIHWVQELAKKNLNWSYDNDEIVDARDVDFPYYFGTETMYNDTECNCPHYAVWNNLDTIHRRFINYSGECNCVYCNGFNFEGEENEGSLLCNDCLGMSYCYDCGCVLSDGDCHTGPDGRNYCCDCYYENFAECEQCGKVCEVNDFQDIQYAFYHDKKLYTLTSERYLCSECLEGIEHALIDDEICLLNLIDKKDTPYIDGITDMIRNKDYAQVIQYYNESKFGHCYLFESQNLKHVQQAEELINNFKGDIENEENY